MSSSPQCEGRCVVRRPYLPEEVQGQNDLQGSGPDHVDVGDEVHEALGVHRHQVHHLAHRGGTSSCVADNQSLNVNEGKRLTLWSQIYGIKLVYL